MRLPSTALRLAGYLHGARAHTGPATVQIDLTDACDQSCAVCWLHSPALRDRPDSRARRGASLPIARVLSLIDELAELGCGEIYYAGGGEPLLHPGLWQALERTVHRGLTASLHTNLARLDEAGEDRLLELGVHHLTVSLWAATRQVYAATHPGTDPETFDRVAARLRRINERKADRPRTKLYHVLTRDNVAELAAMLDLAGELGCDAVEVALADLVPGATTDQALSPAQAREAAAVLEPFARRAPWRTPRLLGGDAALIRLAAVAGGRSGDSDLVHRLPCFAGWDYARVMADGRVIPCLKAHRLPSGDIHEECFAAIWGGARQRTFRSHARSLGKDAPFFDAIGNGVGSGCGCERGCDNLADNQASWSRYRSLTRPERAALRGLALLPDRLLGRSR
jgi:MoaA/NifB/PqqE/SkfB family radical SAM enzyme